MLDSDLDDEVISEASRRGSAASLRVIRAALPYVWRASHSLSGDRAAARRVTRFIVKRALRQMPRWRSAAEAGRWFAHHTVLATRRASRHARGGDDPLRPEDGDVASLALLRALRGLPFQQREALLLTVGEGLSLRDLAIAMDCSTQAAQVHLDGATATLRALAGAEWEARRERLRDAYRAVAADDPLLLDQVQRRVRRHVIPRRVARILYGLLKIALVAAAAALAWWLASRIDW